MAFDSLDNSTSTVSGGSCVDDPQTRGSILRECDREAAVGEICVVLPAFNESRAIQPLLEAIRRTMDASAMPYSVIVVDDGSGDDTSQVASDASAVMPVDVTRHEHNRGLAAALRTGLTMAVARSADEDVVVTMDADDTHPPKLIPGMVDMLSDGPDVVIASRYRPGAKISGVPAGRNWLSFGARLLFQVAFPIRGVRDYTCGYRAYRVGPLRESMDHFGERFITEEGFSCMAEVLLKLRACGVRMGEVPLELNYERRGANSKMKVARTVGQTLSLIVRHRLRGN